MTLSRRELVLANMMEVFRSTLPAHTGGETTWARVLDSPYEGRENAGKNVMSIIEGSENYVEVVSPDKLDRLLDVDLQTRVYVPLGTSLRAGANAVLADIEQIVMANTTWGGYAYATFLLANNVDRQDTGDRTVEISVFLRVQYRARRSDPRAN